MEYFGILVTKSEFLSDRVDDVEGFSPMTCGNWRRSVANNTRRDMLLILRTGVS